MMQRIWFMEGFSSQRDIIEAVKDFASNEGVSLEVYTSHRSQRNEILSVADYALIEPSNAEERLGFIIHIIKKYKINLIHAVKHGQWFGAHRSLIEASGARLVIGAWDLAKLAIAENKVEFARLMTEASLNVVSSCLISNLEELKYYLKNPPFAGKLSIKPVKGIYGIGFWQFDDTASSALILSHPERRIIRTSDYIRLCEEATEMFEPMVLMPYLKGPEYSVDIVACKGNILAAIGRRKEGKIQVLENKGVAFDLACRCAQEMEADGIVNVQTRNNSDDQPQLLEINMRPSGGIGNTLCSGVNLPAIFMMHSFGLWDELNIQTYIKEQFQSVEICALSKSSVYPSALQNRVS